MSSTSNVKPWGRITWYFIHSFCERINEKFFNSNIDSCLDILSGVCSMIPCPTCRNHAQDFLKKYPIKKLVRTKEQLKYYFFKFHNQATLNGNPKSNIPDISVLETYKRANFPAIVKAFRAEYMKRTPTRLDYSHTLYAQRVLKNIMSFLQSNQGEFMNYSTVPSSAQTQNNVESESENITFSITE